MRATRDNLGFLLAKALQRWNELLAAGFRRGGFAEVRPGYGSVLLPLFEEDGLRLSELATRSTCALGSIPSRRFGFGASTTSCGTLQRGESSDGGQGPQT